MLPGGSQAPGEKGRFSGRVESQEKPESNRLAGFISFWSLATSQSDPQSVKASSQRGYCAWVSEQLLEMRDCEVQVIGSHP